MPSTISLVTDVMPGEPDILSPVKHCALIITDFDGDKIKDIPAPAGGWTHEALMALAETVSIPAGDGANAHLGDCWIGSTEV